MRVTWVGHATALIELAGLRILTDPLLTKRVAHLRRRRPLPGSDVYDVDVVLLSHVHLDHLHLPSLRRLRPTAKIITPVGSGRLFRRSGFDDVTEAAVGDTITIDAVRVRAVPAVHKHGRGPHSRVTAPPMGFVVESDDGTVYFPGDTDLFDAMADLGNVDVALLPIWGWGSTLGEGHLNPDRAARATALIQPELLVPIHWGTYAPEDGRRRLPSWFDRPPEDLRAALDDRGLVDRLRLLEPGRSIDHHR